MQARVGSCVRLDHPVGVTGKRPELPVISRAILYQSLAAIGYQPFAAIGYQ
jgi:hypothetical protein